MRSRNEMMPPADAGPVERPVGRPAPKRHEGGRIKGGCSLHDALFVLVMVDKNNRIAAGEKGKAWNGRFVAEEVRRVLDDAARAAGA
jgi:hypothetical protein